MTALRVLLLQNNAFAGEYPAGAVSGYLGQTPTLAPPFTYSSAVDLARNALFADASTEGDLNAVDPDWTQTQTIAPDNLMLDKPTQTQFNLAWDAIPFSSGPGYYQISIVNVVALDGTSEPIVIGQTADKTITEFLTDHLAYGTYTLCVRSFTPASGDQKNALLSDCATVEGTLEPPTPTPLPTATATLVPTATQAPIMSTVGMYNAGRWAFLPAADRALPDVMFDFGPTEPGWQPLVGDWNGDGEDGIGLYRDGMFLLRDTTGSGTADYRLRFGPTEPGWQAIVGDWDGDQVETVGIYRNGMFLLTNSLTSGMPDIQVRMIAPSDAAIAIAGDWDGNGVDTVGLTDRGLWLLKQTHTPNGEGLRFNFGPTEPGWQPVIGDWNEDGVDTPGLTRDGVWRLRNSNSGGAAHMGFTIQARQGQPLSISRSGGVNAVAALGIAPLASATPTTAAPATVTPTATSTPSATPTATATVTAQAEIDAEVDAEVDVEVDVESSEDAIGASPQPTQGTDVP